MCNRATTAAAVLILLAVPYVQAQPPELICVIESGTAGSTGFGVRIMPLGDQNGDGCADLMVGDLLGNTFLYYDSPDADTISEYDLKFEQVVYLMNNIGDVNGDGFDDFVIPRHSAQSGHGRLDLYYGGPEMDTVADQWYGEDDLYGIGYSVLGEDFDDSGAREIISFDNENSGALVFDFLQPFDSVADMLITPANLQQGTDYSNFGNSPLLINRSSSVRDCLVLGLRQLSYSGLSGAIYCYLGGQEFDTIPDLIIERPGGYVDGAQSFGANVLENVGDLNDDGFDDIFASSASADSVGFVFFGGPGLDATPDVVTAKPHTVARAAGDVNHDGFDDLILGYGIDLSTLGGVYVYYGGVDMDSIPDVVITNNETPGYQTMFGRDVTGVGDFNHDGLNDFAFTLNDGGNNDQVFIYSGTDVNSVDYTYDPTLPTDYNLSYNYPNPFNPTTNIQFSLPMRSDVELTVYNILGAEVTRLTEGTLAAGTYTVQWDGRDHNGRAVASGVYLYRLEAGTAKITRKMVLLK
jgi:hypothetical protein